jgi:N-acetylneuraminic acid mutarotase
LALENTGAGTLNFNIFESFAVTPAVQGGAQRITAANFQLVPQTGPASVLSLAALLVDGESVNSPLSGWFGAQDIPGGLVRYAFAQCYEQPEQFFVFGGVDSQGRLSRKSWRFDAGTNTWTALADIPNGGEAPAATCFQGKIYLMGGSGADQFYIYNIASNSWSNGPTLPRGVEGAATAAWAGKVYMVGGDEDFSPGNGVSDQVDVYDIATDTWENLGTPMPIPSGNAGYFQMGPHLYVVGGWGEDAPDTNVSATQRYDMETSTWELGPAFTSARADFALAATGQALYAMGGDEDGNYFFEATDLVERLDLAN